MRISKDVLQEARKQLALLGNKAFMKKTTEEERALWREKGAAAASLYYARLRKKRKLKNKLKKSLPASR